MASKDAAEKNGGKRSSWLAAILCGGIALLASGAATYLPAEQPTPLDLPLPRPPQPIFTLTKDTAQASFTKRVLTESWLHLLAPQPDGVPYLQQGYQSELLGFSMRYPYGSEVVAFGLDSFSQDAIESVANVRIDQPLAAVQISVPSNEGKRQLDYAKQVLADALETDAVLVEDAREVELPAGTLATVAYRRSDEDNNYVHRIYITAAKKKVVIFDFMLQPEFAELGETYASKIMRSLKPGDILGPAMEKPAKLAEPQASAPSPAPKS